MAIMQVHPVFLVDQVRWTRPLEQRTRRATYHSLLKNTRHPIVIHLPDETFLRIAEIYAQIVFLSGRFSAQMRLIARATELIWEIEELLQSVHPRSAWERASAQQLLPTRAEVQEVMRLMREGYASILSIRDLAHKVSLSESALRRAVLAATGLSPREYLHRIRLMKFEELVAESTMPLAEAARSVGWTSPSHARSAFARSHGMSPSEYRAEAQAARRADWLREFGA